MSVLDQLKELDKQREQLINKAKNEALKKAEAAVQELNDMGFNFRLVEGSTPASTGTGKRRTGIRQEVLAAIKQHPNGINRQQLLEKMGAEDKSAEQSISNAISALKKANQIVGEQGVYQPA